ncbi:M1 family aminopeptidase [Culicoidibacter larvae]|nr:M1 family aminopeptidase [Culicoidibacter larvae]
MRKHSLWGLISTAVAVLVLLSACSIPGIPNSSTPPESENVADFSNIHYQLIGDLDVENRVATGTQTTTFTASSIAEPLDTVGFHLYANSYSSPETSPSMGYSSIPAKDALGRITVTEATVNGNKIEKFNSEGQFLELKLPEAIQPGETVEVTLVFNTKVPVSTERFGCYEEICSYTQWHPLLAKYNVDTKTWDDHNYALQGESDYIDDASYNATLTYPEKYTAVTGGVDNEKVLDGKKQLTAELEHGRIFAIIISEHFEIKEKTFDETTIRTVHDSRNTDFTEKDNENLFTDANGAISFFSEKLGEFAYAKQFDIVETAVEGFAMEYSGLVQMGYFFNGQHDYQFYDVVAHEIGHQWMYSKIGSNSASSPFIDEGFTTFITAYYYEIEHQDNPDAEYLGLSSLAAYYTGQTIHGPIGESVYYFDKQGAYAYSDAVYSGTALALNELRLLDGQKLDAVLAAIADKHSYGFVTRNDIYSYIEEQYGVDTKEQFMYMINEPYYKYPTMLIGTQL